MIRRKDSCCVCACSGPFKVRVARSVRPIYHRYCGGNAARVVWSGRATHWAAKLDVGVPVVFGGRVDAGLRRLTVWSHYTSMALVCPFHFIDFILAPRLKHRLPFVTVCPAAVLTQCWTVSFIIIIISLPFTSVLKLSLWTCSVWNKNLIDWLSDWKITPGMYSKAIAVLRNVIEYFNQRGYASIPCIPPPNAAKAFDGVKLWITPSSVELWWNHVVIEFLNIIRNWYVKLTAMVKWNSAPSHIWVSGVRCPSFVGSLDVIGLYIGKDMRYNIYAINRHCT